jgi:hypothetical protein
MKKMLFIIPILLFSCQKEQLPTTKPTNNINEIPSSQGYFISDTATIDTFQFNDVNEGQKLKYWYYYPSDSTKTLYNDSVEIETEVDVTIVRTLALGNKKPVYIYEVTLDGNYMWLATDRPNKWKVDYVSKSGFQLTEDLNINYLHWFRK